MSVPSAETRGAIKAEVTVRHSVGIALIIASYRNGAVLM